FLKAIGDYMLVSTKLEPADACIVFGGGANSARLAHHAAALYKQELFSLAVVTGGVPVAPASPRTEAEEMRDILLEAGMPQDRVLLENKARNTGENVVFSRELLRDKCVNAVLGIGQNHASRRFLMTLRKKYPEAEKIMFSTSNHFDVPPEQWYLDSAFSAAVL